MVREGVDNDGDGRINEDGIGGGDMNRNFPRNRERRHLQPGAGAYPLSEPETRAAAAFVDARRNIAGIVHGHTSGSFVHRLPSASAPSLFPKDDLALIVHLGEACARSTGRPVVPSATHPTEHRYGTFISWAYWDHGVIGWVPEFSPGPEAWVTDYDGDGEASSAEQHRFNDEVLGSRCFSDWTPYDHPQLGAVEIGGWRSKFRGQNPPPEFLEAETAQQLPWILYLAEQTPLLAVTGPSFEPAADDGTVRVSTTVSNTGFLPTSVTGRGAVGRERPDGRVDRQVVRAPAATLEFEDVELVAGRPRVAVPHLAGANSFLDPGDGASATVAWTARKTGDGARVRLVARSDKGGVARSAWVVLP